MGRGIGHFVGIFVPSCGTVFLNFNCKHCSWDVVTPISVKCNYSFSDCQVSDLDHRVGDVWGNDRGYVLDGMSILPV